MTNFYVRKPEVLQAKFWDGSNASYIEILGWMPKFLLPEQGPYCEYWDQYNEEPSPEAKAASGTSWTKMMRLIRALPEGVDQEQALDWHYRNIAFYAWGEDVNVGPESWICFYGSEQDHSDEFPTQRGMVLNDKEFRDRYEPIDRSWREQ